jgi:CubicO group peptidase (beta-lactamase class C family)
MGSQVKWFIVLTFLLLTPLALNSETSSVQNSDFHRDYWPTMGWRGVQPEVQGMNTTLLQAFWNTIYSTDNVQGFLLIRNGYILFEANAPGISPNRLWRIYSCTKSVSAAAFGLALADGLVDSVHNPVLDYFPERTIQNPDPWKSNMEIWHLLTMSSGLERSDFGLGTKPDWVQYLLDSPMAHEPGEFWNYNGGCSHLLSAIITETTGVSMETLVRDRLFTPIGISRYEWGDDPQGVTTGMAGLSLSLRDLAKIAYLYLNNGTWEASQLLPAEWIAECKHPHFVFTYGEGYGYQWWIDIPISGYSMRGAGGMRVFVLPQEDLVIAFGAAPYGSEECYAYFEEFIYPAIIGDIVSLPSSTWDWLFALMMGFTILSISIAIVILRWKQKTP